MRQTLLQNFKFPLSVNELTMLNAVEKKVLKINCGILQSKIN